MKDKLYKEFLSKRKEEIIELKKELSFYKDQFDALIDNNFLLAEVSLNLDKQRNLHELLNLKEIEYSVFKKHLREANNYLIKVKIESKRAVENYRKQLELSETQKEVDAEWAKFHETVNKEKQNLLDEIEIEFFWQEIRG